MLLWSYFCVCPCALMGRRSIVSTYSAPALVSVCLLLKCLLWACFHCHGTVWKDDGTELLGLQSIFPVFSIRQLQTLFPRPSYSFPNSWTVATLPFRHSTWQWIHLTLHYFHEMHPHCGAKNPFSKAIITKVKVYYGLLFDLGHHFRLPKPAKLKKVPFIWPAEQITARAPWDHGLALVWAYWCQWKDPPESALLLQGVDTTGDPLMVPLLEMLLVSACCFRHRTKKGWKSTNI